MNCSFDTAVRLGQGAYFVGDQRRPANLAHRHGAASIAAIQGEQVGLGPAIAFDHLYNLAIS